MLEAAVRGQRLLKPLVIGLGVGGDFLAQLLVRWIISVGGLLTRGARLKENFRFMVADLCGAASRNCSRQVWREVCQATEQHATALTGSSSTV